MKLLVGLGNLGQEYAHTRHNAGWDALDQLATTLEAAPFRASKEWRAELAEARLGSEKILLVKPLTYMNLSGTAVQPLAQFYKISREDILILHDELDFPLGKVAFTVKASSGGHNGIRSLHERFGTEELQRLRLGIGRPLAPKPVEVFVLERPMADEQPVWNNMIKRGAEAAVDWIKHGSKKAMNTWNKKQPDA